MKKKDVYTLQQRRFLSEYAKTLDPQKAALKAGYSHKSAQRSAKELLTKEKYLSELNALIEQKANHLEITNGFIIKKYLQLVDYASGSIPCSGAISANIRTEDEKEADKLSEFNSIGTYLRHNIEPKDPTLLLRALDGLCKQLNNAGFNDERDENTMLTKIIGLNQERI